MLTQDSVPFLFDLGLIPVWSLLNFHSIPVQPSFDFRSVLVWFPVQLPSIPHLFFSLSPSKSQFLPRFSSSKHPFSSPKCPFPLPFSANTLFPLPDKFPLYNIIRCTFPFPAFPFFLIDYQNLPIPQPFTLPCKIYSKKILFYIWLVSHNPVLLHPLSKRRTAFNFDMLQRRRTCLTE